MSEKLVYCIQLVKMQILISQRKTIVPTPPHLVTLVFSAKAILIYEEIETLVNVIHPVLFMPKR